MLGLVTGVPGAKKTVFVVSRLDKTESENKVNLVKNIGYFDANAEIIKANNLENDFTYYWEDVGSGNALKPVMTILDDNYFEILNKTYDELRPDDYYKVATIYNSIIERINEREQLKGLKYLLPVRTIYTNINALKIDFTRSLYELVNDEGNVDWRDAPDGSIIVIDEIQLVEPFKQSKNKDEPIIQDLTIHRHRGFDFYLITQSANLLHVQIKDLIGLHWHITVPWGWVSKVYQYGSFRQNPNAVSIKMAAERKMNFSPPDRLFKLYKSTTINTHQKRIPYKTLAVFGALILASIILFLFSVRNSSDSKLVKGMLGQEVASDGKSSVLTANPLTATATPPPVPSAALDDKTEVAAPTAPPVPSNQEQPRPQYFDPLSGGYISDVNLVPVSAVSMNGKCLAYNASGNIVTSVGQSDCQKYLSVKGMLPKIN